MSKFHGYTNTPVQVVACVFKIVILQAFTEKKWSNNLYQDIQRTGMNEEMY